MPSVHTFRLTTRSENVLKSSVVRTELWLLTTTRPIRHFRLLTVCAPRTLLLGYFLFLLPPNGKPLADVTNGTRIFNTRFSSMKIFCCDFYAYGFSESVIVTLRNVVVGEKSIVFPTTDRCRRHRTESTSGRQIFRSNPIIHSSRRQKNANSYTTRSLLYYHVSY